MTADDRLAKRQAFCERYRHEIGGMVLDAMKPRDGAHAAMFARMILEKVDRQLERIFDACFPAAQPSPNGTLTGVKR